MRQRELASRPQGWHRAVTASPNTPTRLQMSFAWPATTLCVRAGAARTGRDTASRRDWGVPAGRGGTSNSISPQIHGSLSSDLLLPGANPQLEGNGRLAKIPHWIWEEDPTQLCGEIIPGLPDASSEHKPRALGAVQSWPCTPCSSHPLGTAFCSEIHTSASAGLPQGRDQPRDPWDLAGHRDKFPVPWAALSRAGLGTHGLCSPCWFHPCRAHLWQHLW